MSKKYSYYDTDFREDLEIAVNQFRHSKTKVCVLGVSLIGAIVINLNPSDMLGIEAHEIIGRAFSGRLSVGYIMLHALTAFLLCKLMKRLAMPMKKANKKCQSLYELGIRDAEYNTPKFIADWKGYKPPNGFVSPNIWVEKYFSNGIVAEDILNKKDNLGRKTNWRIVDIVEVGNNKTLILKKKKIVTETLYWRSYYLKTGTEFVMGETQYGEQISICLEQNPFVLIGAPTNHGKSYLILLWIHQAKQMGNYQLVFIDMKKGLDFNAYWRDSATFATTYEDACKVLHASEQEMHRRLWLLVGKKNIDVYNETADEPLPRIIVFIDELAQILKQDKRCAEMLLSLTQRARATGIHVIAASQKIDRDLIKTSMFENFILKIQGSTDGVTSRTALNNNDAANIPKIRGWWATNNDKQFRAYVIDDDYECKKYKERQREALLAIDPMELYREELIRQEYNTLDVTD